jgi:HTH-type transcriptional regulator/antitoxin HigA
MENKTHSHRSDYEAALKEIEQLMGSQPGTPEGRPIGCVSDFWLNLRSQTLPIPIPDDPVEVLKYFMEKSRVSRSEFDSYLGSKQRISEGAHRKRGLSIEMIRRLHNGLGNSSRLI